MNDHDAFSEVARRVVPDGRLIGCSALAGGVSATTHALEIAAPSGARCRVVLRRHRNADWKPSREGTIATEFALLEGLHRIGLEVPEPLLLDVSGELLPEPYLVMERVTGSTAVADAELPTALGRLADFLARLHAVELETAALPPLPEREDPWSSVLDHLPDDALGARLRTALEARPAAFEPSRRTLVHGDFWPGNVLWRDGEIAAVIDWEDAAIGDPLSDLACARVELLCAHDETAMEAFSRDYLARAPVDTTDLPIWEVYVSTAALSSMADWGLPPEVEAERRRRTRAFLERAAADLLSRSAS
ncbi:MAG: phosphotransferase family protein [Thermoanaerobaculia bacterium]|nr:phosphotransferase family protein [Thermoanaerobaculia bacterium]